LPHSDGRRHASPFGCVQRSPVSVESLSMKNRTKGEVLASSLGIFTPTAVVAVCMRACMWVCACVTFPPIFSLSLSPQEHLFRASNEPWGRPQRYQQTQMHAFALRRSQRQCEHCENADSIRYCTILQVLFIFCLSGMRGGCVASSSCAREVVLSSLLLHMLRPKRKDKFLTLRSTSLCYFYHAFITTYHFLVLGTRYQGLKLGS